MLYRSLTTSLLLIIGTLFLAARPVSSFAQKVDTIRLKDHRLNTSSLKPGLRQYMVYFKTDRNPKVLRFWLWLRNTQIITRNNEKVFATTQHWYGSDTISYRTGYSLNRMSDFSAIYHSETINGKKVAYNWGTMSITGTDTVANNTKKDFKMDFNEPCFNWNLDIETFEMLPLAAGKSFAINFYDAGFGKPEYVLYKVTGSEVLTTYDGHKVDCWKLVNEGEHAGTRFTQTFWLSKKGHEFLKEEDALPGGYRYKVKMPMLTPAL